MTGAALGTRAAAGRERLARALLADRVERRGSRFGEVLTYVLSCLPPVVMWIMLATGHHAAPNAIEAVDLGLSTVLAPSIWLRRRWPLAFSLAMSVVGTFSLLSSATQIISLATVAIHRRATATAVAAAAFLTSTLLYGVARPDPSTPYLMTVVVGFLLTGGIVAWGMFLRARRQLILSLEERARRAEDEQQLRVEQARQLERTRIAREMHDVLAHRISLVSLHAGALEFRPDAPPDEIAKAAGVIRSSAHQALQDLREVIGVLRTGVGEAGPDRPQPTLGEIPGLVTEARRAGAKVDLDVRIDDPDAVPDVIGRTAYRVVQEGLTNARKHAQGAAVRVTVRGDHEEGLTVEVRNWLPLHAAEQQIPGAGTGIVGLGERVGLAGGRLEHGPGTAGDFHLRAWLPWPQ